MKWIEEALLKLLKSGDPLVIHVSNDKREPFSVQEMLFGPPAGPRIAHDRPMSFFRVQAVTLNEHGDGMVWTDSEVIKIGPCNTNRIALPRDPIAGACVPPPELISYDEE